MTPARVELAGLATTETAGVVTCLQLRGPGLVDYSPKVRPLTRWERIIEYLKVLYA